MHHYNTLYPDDLPNLTVKFDGTGEVYIRLVLRGHDTTATDTVNGPPMVEHPSIRYGRPTSLYDIMGCYEWQLPLKNDERVVPADRNFAADLPRHYNRNQFDVVSVRTLHAEWTKQNKWRGRPSAFTSFNLDQLILWRDMVFDGSLTIRDLAKQAGVSEPAASRFAHGETLWYV